MILKPTSCAHTIKTSLLYEKPTSDWWVLMLNIANVVGTNDLRCLPSHGGAR
jgi:hypothetical protein